MTESIPESHLDIFQNPNFAHVATIMSDGSPQVTPVWIDFDGEHVVFNTVEGRIKARNLDRDNRVAISVHDQQNPYRYVQVRGKVVEKTQEGADDHINAMAKKYLGQDTYPFATPEDTRVIYKISTDKVHVSG